MSKDDALREAVPADDKLGQCLFCQTKLSWQTSDIDGWIACLYCDGCDFRSAMSEWKYADVDEAKADAWLRWIKGIAALAHQPTNAPESGAWEDRCRDCDDTGVTIQTERRCACQPPEPQSVDENTKLAALVKSRLFGVHPDDQDLELEDDDWKRIIAALSQASVSEADIIERCAAACSRVGSAFGERPPSGERGTNIVWDTAERCAAAIRNLIPGKGEA